MYCEQRYLPLLRRRHSAAIDHVFGAGDGAGPRRDEKGDKIGHFLWFRRTAERNAAQRVHDELLATFVVGAGLLGETLGHMYRRLRLHPARRNAHDTNALRRHLLGKVVVA